MIFSPINVKKINNYAHLDSVNDITDRTAKHQTNGDAAKIRIAMISNEHKKDCGERAQSCTSERKLPRAVRKSTEKAECGAAIKC